MTNGRNDSLFCILPYSVQLFLRAPLTLDCTRLFLICERQPKQREQCQQRHKVTSWDVRYTLWLAQEREGGRCWCSEGKCWEGTWSWAQRSRPGHLFLSRCKLRPYSRAFQGECMIDLPSSSGDIFESVWYTEKNDNLGISKEILFSVFCQCNSAWFWVSYFSCWASRNVV